MAVARHTLARSPPVHQDDPSPPHHVKRGKSRCGEVAGGTAAVICCPCSVMNLLMLVLYKLPAKICRRVNKKKKKRRREQQHEGLLQKPARRAAAVAEEEEEDGGVSGKISFEDVSEEEDRNGDKEMFERFYGTGFWRNPSHREDLAAAAD